MRGVRIRKAKLPVFDTEELENVLYWNSLCPDVFVISENLRPRLKPSPGWPRCCKIVGAIILQTILLVGYPCILTTDHNQYSVSV